ncbi:MAG TPA: GldG family protein [Candidatus Acidoferrales bacterium]|nr:GldG family protein [Candidatus Acidoferrales bacterium]
MKKWTRNQWAELAASVGAAAIIGGYVRYSYQGELLLVSKILLIGGGVLLLAAIVLGFEGIVKYFSRRSSQLGTNTTVLALAVLVILGLVNFVSYRHHKRFDLTTEKLYTLSDQTKKVVGALTQDISIARFAKTPNDQLNELMTEYKNLSPHIKFQNVDPTEKPDVAKEYGATRMGDVIVAAGPRHQPLEPGAEGNFSEQDVTATIMKVTRNSVKMVCFVTGHDEKSLDESGAQGYALVDQGLKKEGYNTNSINLVKENGVPASCDIVVIAGPKQGYFSQEASLVSKYLDAGGKLLIEIDPETDPKLDDVFKAWNINVGSNVVVDASGVGRLFGTGPGTPLVVDYGESPITKNLQGGMTFFELARTVSIADKAKSDPQAVELLKTSERSFWIPKLVREVQFDPKTAGPLSLGVAASRTVGDKSARLVVIGNSAFAENQWLGMQHNGDLFFNTIDWLAQDENLISIRPKPATARRITLTQGQMAALQWFELLFLPGFVILVGVSIWWKHR